MWGTYRFIFSLRSDTILYSKLLLRLFSVSFCICFLIFSSACLSLSILTGSYSTVTHFPSLSVSRYHGRIRLMKYTTPSWETETPQMKYFVSAAVNKQWSWRIFHGQCYQRCIWDVTAYIVICWDCVMCLSNHMNKIWGFAENQVKSYFILSYANTEHLMAILTAIRYPGFVLLLFMSSPQSPPSCTHLPWMGKTAKPQ